MKVIHETIIPYVLTWSNNVVERKKYNVDWIDLGAPLYFFSETDLIVCHVWNIMPYKNVKTAHFTYGEDISLLGFVWLTNP